MMLFKKTFTGSLKKHFMMYLPRLCEHCLNPACVASCPSGAIYKREEDGIVLIDQDKCRGWRMCVSGCPYKKIYYNWKSGKSEKCTFCYPRIESGQPTVCSETCVGRIRYLGVLLYDADRIELKLPVCASRKRIVSSTTEYFSRIQKIQPLSLLHKLKVFLHSLVGRQHKNRLYTKWRWIGK
jgi:nitrate reductase beta subunit